MVFGVNKQRVDDNNGKRSSAVSFDAHVNNGWLTSG